MRPDINRERRRSNSTSALRLACTSPWDDGLKRNALSEKGLGNNRSGMPPPLPMAVGLPGPCFFQVWWRYYRTTDGDSMTSLRPKAPLRKSRGRPYQRPKSNASSRPLCVSWPASTPRHLHLELPTAQMLVPSLPSEPFTRQSQSQATHQPARPDRGTTCRGATPSSPGRSTAATVSRPGAAVRRRPATVREPSSPRPCWLPRCCDDRPFRAATCRDSATRARIVR